MTETAGRQISLAHLTVLDTTPPELVTVAAAAGFRTIGIRLTATPSVGVPPYDILHDAHQDHQRGQHRERDRKDQQHFAQHVDREQAHARASILYRVRERQTPCQNFKATSPSNVVAAARYSRLIFQRW